MARTKTTLEQQSSPEVVPQTILQLIGWVARRLQNQDMIRQLILKMEKQLTDTFVQRENEVRVMTLAYLVMQHYLFVGDPGTGKTALVKCYVSHLTGARYFKTLLGAFTPPDKIFGALDIKEFQAGKYKYVIEGMLPGVEFGFLDEYYKCGESSANEMLTLLNEREFGSPAEPVPLMTVGTATNWPELEARTEITNALHDRTLLRCVVEEVHGKDAQVELLRNVDKVKHYTPEVTVSLDELKIAIAAVSRVKIGDDVAEMLIDVREGLLTRAGTNGQVLPGISISSRRIGQLQDVLRASAWLDGRQEVTVEDFGVLQWGLWNERGDVEVVKAHLQTLDQVYVNEVVAKIDEGLRVIKDFNNGQKGAIRLNASVKTAASHAKAARVLADRPVFTREGKMKIQRAMTDFKADYTTIRELAAKAQAQAEAQVEAQEQAEAQAHADAEAAES